jgi:lysozyme
MVDNNDIWDDDEFDFDFDDIGNDRKPVEGTVEISKFVGKEFIKGSAEGIKKAVSESIPELGDLTSSLQFFKYDLSSAKDEILKEFNDTAKTVKEIGSKALPKAEKFIPNKLYKKLDDVFKKQEEVTQTVIKEKSTEEKRNEEIDNRLTELFKLQQEQTQVRNEEERLNSLVDRQLTIKSSAKLNDGIGLVYKELININNFNANQSMAFMKESLRLKYKHVNLARDSFILLQALTKSVENKLNAITKNTSLPEIQKTKHFESFKQEGRARISKGLQDKMSSYGDTIIKNLKGKMSSSLGFGNMMLNMVNQNMDMMDQAGGMMPEEEKGVVGAAGKGAKFGASFLGSKLLTNRFYDINRNIGLSRDLGNLKESAALKVEDIKDKGGVLGNILSILTPSMRERHSVNVDIDNADISKADAVEIAQTEIIPGYLSKIHQEVKALRTGTLQEAEAYDMARREFVSESKLKTRLGEQIFGRKEHRTDITASTLGVVKASLVNMRGDDYTADFDKLQNELAKTIANHIFTQYLIKPDEIIEFIEKGYESKYIKFIFDGVDHKQQVAGLLLKAISDSDGKISMRSIQDINNEILGSMKNINITPKLQKLIDRGETRYLKDFMDKTGLLNQSLAVNTMLSTNIDRDAEVQRSFDITRDRQKNRAYYTEGISNVYEKAKLNTKLAVSKSKDAIDYITPSNAGVYLDKIFNTLQGEIKDEELQDVIKDITKDVKQSYKYLSKTEQFKIIDKQVNEYIDRVYTSSPEKLNLIKDKYTSFSNNIKSEIEKVNKTIKIKKEAKNKKSINKSIIDEKFNDLNDEIVNDNIRISISEINKNTAITYSEKYEQIKSIIDSNIDNIKDPIAKQNYRSKYNELLDDIKTQYDNMDEKLLSSMMFSKNKWKAEGNITKYKNIFMSGSNKFVKNLNNRSTESAITKVDNLSDDVETSEQLSMEEYFKKQASEAVGNVYNNQSNVTDFLRTELGGILEQAFNPNTENEKEELILEALFEINDTIKKINDPINNLLDYQKSNEITTLVEKLTNNSSTLMDDMVDIYSKMEEIINVMQLNQIATQIPEDLNINPNLAISTLSESKKKKSRIKQIAGLSGTGVKKVSNLYGRFYSNLFKVGKSGLNKGFDLAGQSLGPLAGLLGTGITTYGKVATAPYKLLGKMLFNKKGKKQQQDYINVYLKDNVDPGNPLLSIRQLKQGVYFEDGSKVESVAEITEPVFDNNNEVLITEDDINTGLVDVNNNPLGSSITNKIKKSKSGKGLMGKLFSGANSILKLGTDKLLPSYFKGIFGLGSSITKGTTGLLGNILGGENKITKKDLKELVGDKLDKIISLLSDDNEEPTLNSMESLLSSKKNKEKQLRGGEDYDQSSGLLGQAASSAKKKGLISSLASKGLDKGKAGIMSKLSKGKLGSFLKIGGTSLASAGAGTALASGGTAAAGTAGGAGMLASAAGAISAGAGAVAASPVLLAALGVAAVTGIGYGIYKYNDKEEDVKAADELVDVMKETGMVDDPWGWGKWPLTSKGKNAITYNFSKKEIELLLKSEKLDDKAKAFCQDTLDRWSTIEKWRSNKSDKVNEYKKEMQQVRDEYKEETGKSTEEASEYANKYRILKEKKAILKDANNLVQALENLDLIDDPWGWGKWKINTEGKELIKWTFTKDEIKLLLENSMLDEQSMNFLNSVMKNYDSIEKMRSRDKGKQTRMQETHAKVEDEWGGKWFGEDRKIADTGSKIDKNKEALNKLKNIEAKRKKALTIANKEDSQLDKVVKDWIKGHEGLRLYEYKDSLGYSTIGYGHLNTEGYDKITKQEAEKLFDQDYEEHKEMAKAIPEYNDLDPVRKSSLLNLIYNLGPNGFLNFKKTRQLLKEGKYLEAGKELLNSTYAKQVGKRSTEVAQVLATGDISKIKPRAIDTGDKSKVNLNNYNTSSAIKVNDNIQNIDSNKSTVVKADDGVNNNNIANKYTKTEEMRIADMEKGFDKVVDKLTAIFGNGEVFNNINENTKKSAEKEIKVEANINQSNEPNKTDNNIRVKESIGQGQDKIIKETPISVAKRPHSIKPDWAKEPWEL